MRLLYLNAGDQAVSFEPFAAETEIAYDPMKESVIFDYKFNFSANKIINITQIQQFE